MAKKIRVWDGTDWVPVGIQNEAAQASVDTHNADTTNVHGIADTSLLATQTYVNNQISALIDAAPASLDTLNELAAALNDDASFATTVTNQIATKTSVGKAIAISLVFGG